MIPAAWYRALLLPLLLCAGLRAAIYDYSLGDAEDRRIRLNIPDSLPRVRGLIIYVNGAGGDARGHANEDELSYFAEQQGFAIMATARWGGLNAGTSYDLVLLESSLVELAFRSGHTELNTVPWLPIGHSLGGMFSYGLAENRPEKVISFLVSKSSYRTTPRPLAPTLAVPGLLIQGELDPSLYNADILDRFTGNRARAALWAFAQEQGMNHSEGSSLDLSRAYEQELVRLRMPADRTSAWPLSSLSETDGWLGDVQGSMTGLATIAPRATYPGDKYAAAWLPTRRLAFLWRAFASHNKACPGATLLPRIGPLPFGTRLSYELPDLAKPYSKIEYYEGDTLLRTSTPADTSPLRVLHTALSTGYLVFHAVVTFSDGTQAASPPRRCLIKAPPTGPLVLGLSEPLTLEPGLPARLSVEAWGNGLVQYQWYKNGEALAGQTGAVLAFGAVGATDSGDYSVGLRDTLGSTRSAAVRLTVATPQPGRLINLSIRSQARSRELPVIMGFSVQGGPVPLLIRGIGPALTAYGISSPLPDPLLEFHQSIAGVDTIVAHNDNWGDGTQPGLDALCRRLGAFLPASTSSRDAMLLRSCTGLATISLYDPNASGLALGEIYDAGDGSQGRLVNVSARNLISGGENVLVAGFVISGNYPRKVLIRGIGPKLADYGVATPLADPILSLYEIRDGQSTLVAGNDNWGDADVTALKDAFAASGAFDLGANTGKDSALLITLPAGMYTAILSGVASGTGDGLIEVYDLSR